MMSFGSPTPGQKLHAGALVALLLLAGCAGQPGDESTSDAMLKPELHTKADSLAFQAVNAAGGLDAWPRVPLVRFDFAVEQDGSRTLRRKHMWNRMTGDYRLERPVGTDSMQVVLFNVNTREGRAFVNGNPVDQATATGIVERAYATYINDMYWLSMPMKLFDGGVIRDMEPDSSAGGMSMLALSFDGVGLTPGDRYWVSIDDSGMVRRWTYLLQGSDRPRTYAWLEYKTFDTPAGTVKLAEAKRSATAAILTDNISLPASVSPDVFSDPGAMLD